MRVVFEGEKIRKMPNGSRTLGGFKFNKANDFTVEMTEEEWEGLGRRNQHLLRVLTPEEVEALDEQSVDGEDDQEVSETPQDDGMGDVDESDSLDDPDA